MITIHRKANGRVSFIYRSLLSKTKKHFLELSCFCHDPADVGNSISGSSAFSKSSLNIWKFTVRILLKPAGPQMSLQEPGKRKGLPTCDRHK